MQLKVVAERKPGFDAPIHAPDGLQPAGRRRRRRRDRARARPRRCSRSTPRTTRRRRSGRSACSAAPTPTGRVWVLDAARRARGRPAAAGDEDRDGRRRAGQGRRRSSCNVEQKTPFEGKAKVQARRPAAERDRRRRRAGDHAGRQAGRRSTSRRRDKTPVGQHKSLLCVVTVTKDGEPIVHNLGQRRRAPRRRPAAARAGRRQRAEPRRSRRSRQAAAAGAAGWNKLRQEAAAQQGK